MLQCNYLYCVKSQYLFYALHLGYFFFLSNQVILNDYLGFSG